MYCLTYYVVVIMSRYVVVIVSCPLGSHRHYYVVVVVVIIMSSFLLCHVFHHVVVIVESSSSSRVVLCVVFIMSCHVRHVVIMSLCHYVIMSASVSMSLSIKNRNHICLYQSIHSFFIIRTTFFEPRLSVLKNITVFSFRCS